MSSNTEGAKNKSAKSAQVNANPEKAPIRIQPVILDSIKTENPRVRVMVVKQIGLLTVTSVGFEGLERAKTLEFTAIADKKVNCVVHGYADDHGDQTHENHVHIHPGEFQKSQAKVEKIVSWYCNIRAFFFIGFFPKDSKNAWIGIYFQSLYNSIRYQINCL